jgi:hypothetical protein
MSEQPQGGFRGRIRGTGGPSWPGSTGAGPGGPGSPWSWTDVVDRPRLPWFGVFLVVFGGLLLLEQVVPGSRVIGSGLVVAVGIALLIAWAVNRNVWQLYAGAILTALSLPSLLQDLNVIHEGQGYGTFFLGIAFLAIALFRWGAHGGVGWQAIIGGVLAVIGGAQVAEREIPNFPSLERLAWPALILVVGLLLVLRSMGARRSPGP